MSPVDTQLYLRDDFADKLPSLVKTPGALFTWAHLVTAQAQAASIYRSKNGRTTLRFELDGEAYFLKLHRGVGWREIFKNLLRGRIPVLGARDEYIALKALREAGVATLSVAAFASCGWNPARRRSFIVTDELSGTVSLEDFCAGWAQSPPPLALRVKLIRKLAEIAGAMHDAGINHRDFYLCHFHIDANSVNNRALSCSVIDLHRAQLRDAVPRRWRERDLAALYFSAMDCGVTRRDCQRFVSHYTASGSRVSLARDGKFWRRVEQRALRLYKRGRSDATGLSHSP